MKEIELTQGKMALVDDADFEWLNQWKWYAQRQKRGRWYVTRQSEGSHATRRKLRMHQVILGVSGNVWVDHRDNNGLNNVRSNLRLCNITQNGANRKVQVNNRSGFKGVRWIKGTYKVGRWRVTLQFEGKKIPLGFFTNKEEAARAYDAGARKYFGEFARTNYGN